MVCASFASPDQVMAVPSANLGDFLVAHWAESSLFLPQMQESPFACQVALCFHVQTLFKVRFPGWIEWVGCSLDGSVPLDFHIDGSSEVDGPRVFFLAFDFSCEDPVVVSFRGEGFATCAEAMIGRPPPNDRVQLHDQLPG